MTPDEAVLLAKLARQFPQKFIHSNPSGGGSYVAHPVVRQRLLATFGLYDFTLVEILRGSVAGKAPNPSGGSARAKAGTPDLDNVVVGAVCRLTLPRADGRLVSVEDVGDCEEPQNWAHDGARLKDAMSDALKRCAMGTSVALHLWCKPGEYRLDAALEILAGGSPGSDAGEVGGDAAETTAPRAPEVLAAGMVTARDAKAALVDAYSAGGAADPKGSAAGAWKAARIAAGPIPQAKLDVMLAAAVPSVDVVTGEVEDPGRNF